MSNVLQQEREMDLGQIFSDVSRTVNGIKHMFNGDAAPLSVQAAAQSSEPQADIPLMERGAPHAGSSASPFAGIFGGQSSCFKTCGMEDIQWASRKAGELFMALRTCTIVLTIFFCVVCCILLTVSLCHYYLHYYRGRRFPKDTDLGAAYITDHHAYCGSLRKRNEEEDTAP